MTILDVSSVLCMTKQQTISLKNKALRKIRTSPIVRKNLSKYFEERYYNRNYNIDEK